MKHWKWNHRPIPRPRCFVLRNSHAVSKAQNPSQTSDYEKLIYVLAMQLISCACITVRKAKENAKWTRKEEKNVDFVEEPKIKEPIIRMECYDGQTHLTMDKIHSWWWGHLKCESVSVGRLCKETRFGFCVQIFPFYYFIHGRLRNLHILK